MFKTGVSANPTGRPKGAKNRDTRVSRDFLINFVKKIGGEKEFLKLYNDPKNNWAQRLLWEKYFDLIPKELQGDFNVTFNWLGENGESNGPL